MALALSIIVFFEIVSALLAVIVFFRKRGFSAAESFSYAFVVLLSFYSATIQIFFLLRVPGLYYMVDCLVIAAAAAVLLANPGQLRRLYRDLVDGIAAHRAFIIPFLVLYVYLFAQVLMLPPSSEDSMSYHLARVLMMQQDSTLFLENGSTLRQVSFPVGWDVLHFLFLRFYSDYFLAIFSFLSYTAVMTATYSLVDNTFRDRRLGFTAAVIVCSLIEVVLQSTSTKNDLPSAALVTVGLLGAYKFLEVRNGYNLLLLVTALLFAAVSKGYTPAFAVPFCVLYCIVLFRKYSLRDLRDSLRPFRKHAALSLLPLALLVCFGSLGVHNMGRYGNAFGAPLPEYYQREGLRGAGFNALRYAVQAVDLPTRLGARHIERLNEMIDAKTPRSGAVRNGHELGPSGRRGSPVRWGRVEEISWFGPLGLLVVLPAVFFTLARGDRFQRLTALSLLIFCFAICYKVAWGLTNSRFFSIFFAGSGLCVGFFLKKAAKRNHFKYLIILSLLIFAYAAFSNQRKPFLDVPRLAARIRQREGEAAGFAATERRDYLVSGPLVLNWLSFARNRDAYFDEEFSSRDVMGYLDEIEAGRRVLIIGIEDSWIYPFLIRRPDLHFTATKSHNFRHEGRILDLTDPAHLSSVAGAFDYIMVLEDRPPSSLDGDRLMVNWNDQLFLYDYTGQDIPLQGLPSHRTSTRLLYDFSADGDSTLWHLVVGQG